MNRGFRLGQVVSGGLLALAHGTNDAQKTMGVITLALIANGNLVVGRRACPFWVVVSAATRDRARHLQRRLADHPDDRHPDHQDGRRAGILAPRAPGAAVILASTHFGFPLSTTQVINGGVMGAGAGKRLSAVRWGVAGNIVVAWLLTLPAAAAIGARDLRLLPALRQRRGRPGDRLRPGDRRAGAVVFARRLRQEPLPA